MESFTQIHAGRAPTIVEQLSKAQEKMASENREVLKRLVEIACSCLFEGIGMMEFHLLIRMTIWIWETSRLMLLAEQSSIQYAGDTWRSAKRASMQHI